MSVAALATLAVLDVSAAVTGVLVLLTCFACGYAWFAAFTPAPGEPRASRRDGRTPVSVLKPLCGMEPHLRENLASFCVQQHPCYQVICGVASPSDPAVAIVRRLQAEFPECDLRLVIDARVCGRNRKVSNLINIAQHARHDRIVIADSDKQVLKNFPT
ncbi:MAG: hypothetical protein GAK40_00955 [Burkholderia plantarii]|nr:MAG: hypothetical protein GAK40_00955 [Burkholderia plantarii]